MSLFMVCKSCLKRLYGGSSKSCGHGWDLLAGKPRVGPCSECGQITDDLNCPDGPKDEAPSTEPVVE